MSWFKFTRTGMYGLSRDDYHMKKYIQKISEMDDPFNVTVSDSSTDYHINLIYASDILKLAKILDKEIIITYNERETEGTVEIYDDWRE